MSEHNDAIIQNMSRVGLEAANFLVENIGEYLVYNDFTELLFQRMEEEFDLVQIRFYIIDREMENLIEESVYNNTGWLPGYGLIPVSSLSGKFLREKIKRYTDYNFHYLRVLLHSGSKLLGLMEFGTKSELPDVKVKGIQAATQIISFALGSVLFETDTIREKENTEFNIQLNDNLQDIDDIDKLISRFLKMTMEYFRFDRITVFIFDKDRENAIVRGISEKGREYSLNILPELPDLTEDYLSLGNRIGYWFPLRTTTGQIGMVLYDNLYTLHKISDSVLNSLRILSTEFAKALDNINMYSSLQKAAHFDRLTGLYNRNYLEEILDIYNRQSVFPFSVIMGDLNGLKLTNDVFGHNTGDQLLKRAAKVLKESCTEEDIIIRSGGDEFLVLLPGRDELAAKKITEIIKEKSSGVRDLKVELSISMGYAARNNRREKLFLVIRRAEDRMYRRKLSETNSFRRALISSLKVTLEEKCCETQEHTERMAGLALQLGEKMGLVGSEIEDLRLLAMLHDIGKVAVNSDILNKPGPLTGKEWEEVRKHPETGFRIAHASYEFSQIANYILCHHEWWNGNGYPLGRKGKEIPLPSRIISVVDAYDVMTHDRPYKKAVSHEEALEELKRCAGTQFDPEIVQIFTTLEFD